MTVKELIKLLREKKPSATVVVDYDDIEGEPILYTDKTGRIHIST